MAWVLQTINAKPCELCGMLGETKLCNDNVMSSVECFPLPIHHIVLARIDSIGSDTLQHVNKVLDPHMGKFTVIIMEIQVFKTFSFLDLLDGRDVDISLGWRMLHQLHN